MTQEIERKFLLKNIPWAEHAGPGSLIEEYYISQLYNGDMRYRYESESPLRKKRYIAMLKTATDVPGVNVEGLITDITPEFYAELVSRSKYGVISKTRKVFATADPNQKIEVDVYTELKLVMMEIELPHLNYPLSIPYNLSKQIVAEVTGIAGFSNKSLWEGFKLKA